MGRAKPLAAMFVVSVGSVMFLSACKEAEAPTPEATVTTTPAATATQPAIIVAEPRDGAEVTVPVTVKGTASVFEGTVIIAVESADGSETFCKTFTTASRGRPGPRLLRGADRFPATVTSNGRPRSSLQREPEGRQHSEPGQRSRHRLCRPAGNRR